MSVASTWKSTAFKVSMSDCLAGLQKKRLKKNYFYRQIFDSMANTLHKKTNGQSMKTIFTAGITDHLGQSVYIKKAY